MASEAIKDIPKKFITPEIKYAVKHGEWGRKAHGSVKSATNGTRRSAGRTVIGAIVGAVIGLVVGVVIVAATGSDSLFSYSWLWQIFVPMILGAVLFGYLIGKKKK